MSISPPHSSTPPSPSRATDSLPLTPLSGRLLDRLDRAAADSLPDMAPAYNAVKGLADFCAKAAHEGGVVAGSGAGGAAGGGGGGGRGRKVQRRR